jgi:hypothetical protein
LSDEPLLKALTTQVVRPTVAFDGDPLAHGPDSHASRALETLFIYNPLFNGSELTGIELAAVMVVSLRRYRPSGGEGCVTNDVNDQKRTGGERS